MMELGQPEWYGGPPGIEHFIFQSRAVKAPLFIPETSAWLGSSEGKSSGALLTREV
jgi:hypothetical protein